MVGWRDVGMITSSRVETGTVSPANPPSGAPFRNPDHHNGAHKPGAHPTLQWYNKSPDNGARSSAAEQAAHNRSVVGSNPTGPTF